MESFKFKKQYLLINALLIITGIALMITSIAISDRSTVYYLGIADRIVFSVCFIFNGIWNYATDYYSIANNSRFRADNRSPKWPWLLVAAIGLGMLVTAFMGYGFNNVEKPV